jgi:CBS domain-containing protein
VNAPTITEHNMNRHATGQEARKNGVDNDRSPRADIVVHPRAAAATVADVMRPPLTTVSQQDYVAVAACRMKHAGTNSSMVTGRPSGTAAVQGQRADPGSTAASGEEADELGTGVGPWAR